MNDKDMHNNVDALLGHLSIEKPSVHVVKKSRRRFYNFILLLAACLSIGFCLVMPVWSDKTGLEIIQDWISSSNDSSLTPLGDDPPLDNTSLGWETLDNGTVFHMWNQYNDYYFNRSSGVQFTNHYEEYWTRNVLMLGYYSGGQWNLLYRVDELSGFSEVFDNTSEYINVTLWKDLNYMSYDFRLALRYHLGINDSDLTIVPYIKNLGIVIPFDIGFGWEMKDIKISNTIWQDQININETAYLLNQTLNEKYNNITKTICEYNKTTNTTTNYTVKDGSFYLENINNITGNVDYNLYLKWNPELDYLVTVKSRSGQYNAPVTLFIKAGTLNVGQEKSTEMHWFDSDTLYERYNTGDSNYANVCADVWQTQTFTIGNTGTDEDHDVTSVKLKVYRLSTPGEITVSIRATDGNGKPTGGNLCSCVYDGDTLPTTADWIEFTFSSSAALSASTKYAVIIAAPNGVKWTKAVRWYYDSSSPTYTGGSGGYSADSGSTWTLDTGDDFMFEEYGIASGPSNTAPTQSLQKIWNSTTSTEKSLNATAVDLQPTCFNVTIADIDADQMNVTIKTNESGTWTIVNQTASGMSNGTYHGYNTSWVDSYNTKYWISFNVSDDSEWCNETFWFWTYNKTNQRLGDHWFLGGNVSSNNQLGNFWFLGNNISNNNQLGNYWFQGGNISSNNQIANYWFLGENVSSNNQLGNYWFLGGNVSVKSNQRLGDHWFLGGNTSSNNQLGDYWFLGGNTTARINEPLGDFWFLGGNETDNNQLGNFWFLGGNETVLLDIYDEYPSNESNVFGLQPTIRFSLTNPTGDPMNYTIYTGNSTTNCTHYLDNISGVNNGTYHYVNYYNATNYTVDYYWRVYAEDGTQHVNKTFYFTLSMQGGQVISSQGVGISIAAAGMMIGVIALVFAISKRKKRSE